MTNTFSKRSSWPQESNRLTQALERKRLEGVPILDLTESNPTKCVFDYTQKYLSALSLDKEVLNYKPDPKGSLEVRQLIAEYYAQKKVTVDPEHIILTASTSESYGYCFKLLCDVGDEVLIPRPGYPLFDLIADLHDIKLKPYFIQQSLRTLDVAPNTKAMVIVHPNNPTGQYFTKSDLNVCYTNLLKGGVSLIADEVFLDYCYQDNEDRVQTFAEENKMLTFTLGGASKMLGLPQLKLGWIVVSGSNDLRDEALRRLEIISDTYLSVSAAAQSIFKKIYKNKNEIQNEIKDRVLNNLHSLQSCFLTHPSLHCQSVEGGWYALLKSEHDFDDEAFCLKLLEEENIFVHPGYFFDLPPNRFLGISLIPKTEDFKKALPKLVKFAETFI